MKYYIAVHTHRHGISTYLFTTNDEFGVDDFAKWLGDDYESDREDEFLDVEEVTPIKFSAESIKPGC